MDPAVDRPSVLLTGVEGGGADVDSDRRRYLMGREVSMNLVGCVMSGEW
jgi:hypothetical protein